MMTFQPARRHGGRLWTSGFTLAEVLVAGAVVSFAFVAFYLCLSQSFSNWQRSRERMRANQILVERLEVIRLYTLQQLRTPGFVPETFTEYYDPLTKSGVLYHGTVTITDMPLAVTYQTNLSRVLATLKWERGGVSGQETMETLVSQYGIQNYIY